MLISLNIPQTPTVEDMMETKWYVVQVYSSFEKKVAQALRENAEKKGLTHEIEEILIPSETIAESKRGKVVQKEQSVFPGYILIRMNMTDDVWHLVKDTPKVTGFLGGRVRPTPISEREVAHIVKHSQETAEHPAHPASLFEVGEQVRVADGPFTSFNGIVEQVDADKGRLTVSVSIFGRSTPVDLEYSQVEKA